MTWKWPSRLPTLRSTNNAYGCVFMSTRVFSRVLCMCGPGCALAPWEHREKDDIAFTLAGACTRYKGASFHSRPGTRRRVGSLPANCRTVFNTPDTHRHDRSSKPSRPSSYRCPCRDPFPDRGSLAPCPHLLPTRCRSVHIVQA